jgi:hypothetical protein
MNSVRTSQVAAVSVVIVAAGRLGHFSFLLAESQSLREGSASAALAMW